MSLTVKRFPWIFSMLWLLILVIMIAAGFWQLGRAEEKRQINTRLVAGDVDSPSTLKDWEVLKAFDQVEVEGRFLSTHFLLDNQIMDGEVGFFVFSAFETQSDILLLINRGWTDDDTQSFDLDSNKVKLKALVADWPRPGIKLGEQIINNQTLQHLTYLEQEPALKLLERRHCSQSTAENCIILTQVLKLDMSTDHGFKRHWQLPRMTVEKHQAYAAQWFTMSLVLCIIYGIFIRKNYANKN